MSYGFKYAYKELADYIEREMMIFDGMAKNADKESDDLLHKCDLVGERIAFESYMRYDLAARECARILKHAATLYDNVCENDSADTSYINGNGRVSLHLLDCEGRCVLDLDCYADEMPKAVYCEVFQETWGVRDYFRTQADHAEAHRVHEMYGYALTDVYCNEEERNYYWTNDAGDWVQGDELPKVWYANYRDVALVEIV